MESLDLNQQFLTYKKETLTTITYQDLFANRRVLICSVVRPMTNLAKHYINYLTDSIPHYRALGIDDVYIVNSADGKFVLARFEYNHPGITALYDEGHYLVNYLRQQQNKQQTLDVLSKYWSYQVLVNNGQVERFYEQPTEKYIKNIVESGYRLNLDNHRLYATQPEEVMLHRPHLMAQEQYFEMVNIEQKDLITGAVLYYKLWPNQPLDEYLNANNTESKSLHLRQ
jgi:peroxiredoxin